MPQLAGRLAKIALLLLALGSLYAVALHKHAQREEIRKAAVALTPGCTEKLGRYGLAPGKKYASSYVMERTGARVELRGYSEEDVRAIERGCNIIDDSQGALATDPWRERWNAKRFIRGNHVSCDHCHRGIGDLQDASGNRLPGSNSLAASWTMGDMYDRFTGLLLPYEMRQMQCYINSSNGYKPNVADDVIRDVTAYSRFLSAALDLKIANHYEEQGIDEIPASATLKQGDDYIRGEVLYNEKCQGCHGLQGIGLGSTASWSRPPSRDPTPGTCSRATTSTSCPRSSPASSAATCRRGRKAPSSTRIAATSRSTSATCPGPRATGRAPSSPCSSSSS